MKKTTTPINDTQEIEQEERELKREYLIFVPILVLIVVLITLALPDSTTSKSVELVPASDDSGYWILHDGGLINNYGSANILQSINPASDSKIVSATAAMPGLWTVSNKGHTEALGGASYAGGIDSVYLQKEAVELINLPGGRAYRIVTYGGDVYDFNTSPINGKTSLSDILGKNHREKIVAATSTASGNGYWLIGKSGAIYSFGDAKSIEKLELNKEIIVDAEQSGDGLLIITNTGRVLALGGANYFGGLNGKDISASVVDIDPTSNGDGYWILLSDATVHALGNAENYN